jgi:hypothetical protein
MSSTTFPLARRSSVAQAAFVVNDAGLVLTRQQRIGTYWLMLNETSPEAIVL